MQSLSADQIVRLWEIGQRQHPLDRALTCLLFASPGSSWATLKKLSVGQRDAALLLLRDRTFGSQLDSVAICPNCQMQLEFSLTTTNLLVSEVPNVANLSLDALVPTETFPEIYQRQIDDLSIEFRLPDSQDLAAVAAIADPTAARQTLLKRCLLQVQQNDQTLEIETLPDQAIALVNQQLLEADPQAEILLDLACPNCEHQWQVLFDIAAFFWTELSAKAQRLLSEVHRLARFYGWREADILAMSSTRRQYYLELSS